MFLEDFRRHLGVGISWRLRDDALARKTETADITWTEDDAEVLVHMPVGADDIARMNGHASLRAYLSQLLDRYYRYTGRSRFDVERDIPF